MKQLLDPEGDYLPLSVDITLLSALLPKAA
jgi:hypothetical protein